MTDNLAGLVERIISSSATRIEGPLFNTNGFQQEIWRSGPEGKPVVIAGLHCFCSFGDFNFRPIPAVVPEGGLDSAKGLVRSDHGKRKPVNSTVNFLPIRSKEREKYPTKSLPHSSMRVASATSAARDSSIW